MGASAIAGGLVWLVVVGAALSGRSALWLLEPLFLLAPLVLVPLALNLIEGPRLRPGFRFYQPAAALAATASFFLPTGATAAALALAWTALTLLIAWDGLRRLRARGPRGGALLAIDAGRLFLPVGGFWLVLARLGVTPLGFAPSIVLLTAIHFHFAGFIACVLVGHAGRTLGGRHLHPAMVAGVVGGTPLLAAGITFSPLLECLGATVLAAALWAFAFWLLRGVSAVAHRGARALLVTSALALLPSMAAAAAYGWGAWGHPLIALSWMARIHGPLNAFGFALAGLLGWTLAARNLPLPSR